MGDCEALPLVAKERLQQRQVLIGFDTIGSHREWESMPQADDCFDNGSIMLRCPYSRPKTSVDLQSVEGQRAQVTARGSHSIAFDPKRSFG